jgi:ribosomal-protein-alanine N-acetyltransferase
MRSIFSRDQSMLTETITIREPMLEDEGAFLRAMQASRVLHHPWVVPPLTSEEFSNYIYRYRQSNQKSYLVIDHTDALVGVFNISEIVRGPFQNAYLGFFSVSEQAAKGKMSAGLKLVLEKGFNELGLHRFEANIQPENTRSIQLVQKNKFRKEGYSPRYLKINDEWRDHERWAITREDWESL